MRRLACTVALCAAVLPPATARAQPAATKTLVLLNANLIDGTGAAARRNVSVIVEGGRIARIVDGRAPIPTGADTIDVAGRWVLPGLIDVHTHIATLPSMRRALESGVTTVRSASVPAYQDVGARELVRRGVLPGPDMLAAGVFVTPYLGETAMADPRLAPFAREVMSPDALRAVVNINADRGVDVIKTRATERAGLADQDPRKQVYDEAQLRVIVEAAAARNLKVLVHAHGDEGAYAAVKAGAHSIEHGTYLSDSTLALMKQRGTYFVPTYATVVDLTSPGGDYDEPPLRVRGLHMLPRLGESVRKAHALGVPVVAGGDTQYGPQSVTRIPHEVAFFVDLGFSPMDAIRSATAVAARCLGIDQRTGTLVPGKEADLIVVERNPLEDVRALQDVLVVVADGRVALNRVPFGLGR
ncbi:MAG: amidohydrolase family protein [Gemmatimonadaceae bacterium]|jgi:imidazolonepropionase-like amidohydrolase|nr:amidohydrolase family protein [Gemmatimonadaceae bacterium]